ncbi:hypothetical protein HanXRQr2_Chr09g0382051 [Helianthus annuus]|uniref:Uncharacterized protein n=1 Tax=Helianthus annuus TaxID=4232 RepID=A0A251TU03_HELAN|nr:hypothetical protein HanXRQr2_Chr09g0382051 [Helianthus annuus]KAJ0892628.1 hypothetical protein HanPSC8_Chr09g0368141 [Helianthus annuus]
MLENFDYLTSIKFKKSTQVIHWETKWERILISRESFKVIPVLGNRMEDQAAQRTEHTLQLFLFRVLVNYVSKLKI